MNIKGRILVAVIGLVLITIGIAGFIFVEPDTAKHVASTALSLLNQVPGSIYEIVGTSIVAAVSTSSIGLGIKKWFDVDSEKKMILIVSIGSFVASLVGYLITDPAFAPWIIGVEGFITLGMTQPFYLLFLKPTAIKLGAAISNRFAKAAMEIEARAAQVPSGGLPSPTPSYSNFK